MSDKRQLYRVYGTWEVFGYTDIKADNPGEAVKYVEGTNSPTVIKGTVEDSFKFDKVEVKS